MVRKIPFAAAPAVIDQPPGSPGLRRLQHQPGGDIQRVGIRSPHVGQPSRRRRHHHHGCRRLSGGAGGDHGARDLVPPRRRYLGRGVIVLQRKTVSNQGGKNEVQDSRSRSDGVHCGSIGHHCKCCSPYGYWPSASRACACACHDLRLQFAVSGGNAAAVEAVVGPTQQPSGIAKCIGSGWNQRGAAIRIGSSWNQWTSSSWSEWKVRSERWTGCFVLGLDLP
jgi:hypothetical protein